MGMANPALPMKLPEPFCEPGPMTVKSPAFGIPPLSPIKLNLTLLMAGAFVSGNVAAVFVAIIELFTVN